MRRGGKLFLKTRVLKIQTQVLVYLKRLKLMVSFKGEKKEVRPLGTDRLL